MKEKILKYFEDVNGYYNDCMRYEELSRMIDELIEETKSSLLDKISSDINEELGDTISGSEKLGMYSTLRIINKYKGVCE